MAGGGKGGKQEVVQSTQVDPQTQAYLNNLRYRTQGVVGPAIDRFIGNPTIPDIPGADKLTTQGQGLLGSLPVLKQANDAYGQASGALGQGLGILGRLGQGDASSFYNPYEQQVIGGVQSDFDRQRGLANAAAQDATTRAGAFGGSRGAVLQANALNDVNRNETSTLANLRNQGYTDSFNRALGVGTGLGQMGLAGAAGLQQGAGLQLAQAQALQQAGEYNRALKERQLMDPYNRALQGLGILQGGLGMSGTTTSAPMSSSPLQSGLGGAATGFAIGGPVGAAIGGGAGLLGGWLGW